MTQHSKIILKRKLSKRIFVSIEGKDGVAFMAWLQKQLTERGTPVRLDYHSAEGGGYSKMLQLALRQKNKKQQKDGKYNGGAFLFVDADRAQSQNDCSLTELQKMAGEKITILSMKPNFEGVILGILSGKSAASQDAPTVKRKLSALWTDYKKPIREAHTFTNKFDKNALSHLKNSDAEWAIFFRAISLDKNTA